MMSTSTTVTSQVHVYLGRCKRCKKAGKPFGHRMEVEVERKITVVDRSDRNLMPIRNAYSIAKSLNGEILGSGKDVSRLSKKCACDSFVTMTRLSATTSDHKCGARCRASTGPVCECSCGGKNHGSNH